MGFSSLRIRDVAARSSPKTDRDPSVRIRKDTWVADEDVGCGSGDPPYLAFCKAGVRARMM